MERILLDHQFRLCKCIEKVVEYSSGADSLNLLFNVLITIDNTKVGKESPWKTFSKSCSFPHKNIFWGRDNHAFSFQVIEHSSLTISMCQVQPILTGRRIGGVMLAQTLQPDIVNQMESEISTDKVFKGRGTISLDDSHVSVQNVISIPLASIKARPAGLSPM